MQVPPIALSEFSVPTKPPAAPLPRSAAARSASVASTPTGASKKRTDDPGMRRDLVYQGVEAKRSSTWGGFSIGANRAASPPHAGHSNIPSPFPVHKAVKHSLQQNRPFKERWFGPAAKRTTLVPALRNASSIDDFSGTLTPKTDSSTDTDRARFAVRQGGWQTVSDIDKHFDVSLVSSFLEFDFLMVLLMPYRTAGDWLKSWYTGCKLKLLAIRREPQFKKGRLA